MDSAGGASGHSDMRHDVRSALGRGVYGEWTTVEYPRARRWVPRYFPISFSTPLSAGARNRGLGRLGLLCNFSFFI